MYQQISKLCSTKTKASGPEIDPDVFFSNPSYQQEAIECLTSVPRKEFSCNISRVMDRLGYSYDMVKYRQKMHDEIDKLKNRHENQFYQVVTTGGKGEGTTLLYESDFDVMRIFKDVICAENPQDFIHQEDITLFQTERHAASPGYTRLKLLRRDGRESVDLIRQSLFKSQDGSYYLSSQFVNDTIQKNVGHNFGVTAGPSTPIHCTNMSFDNVVCFRCFFQDIIKRWESRPRFHGWPSPETIHEICLLDGHVVPCGLKGSENMFREWRICYSLAELHLMRNLNESQLKVYILLKNLSKSVLNPFCEHMTSYIMKNVVLWMCETKGVHRFTTDLLMDRLLDCLIYLRACIKDNNLPSYLIPDRNLLAGRLDIQFREELTRLLNNLLHEGGKMLLRCDKIRDAMLVQDRIPYMFREYMEKRDEIESMLLMRLKICNEIYSPEMSDEEYEKQVSQEKKISDIVIHVEHLMQFDEPALRQMGKTNDEINNLRIMKIRQLIS